MAQPQEQSGTEDSLPALCPSSLLGDQNEVEGAVGGDLPGGAETTSQGQTLIKKLFEMDPEWEATLATLAHQFNITDDHAIDIKIFVPELPPEMNDFVFGGLRRLQYLFTSFILSDEDIWLFKTEKPELFSDGKVEGFLRNLGANVVQILSLDEGEHCTVKEPLVTITGFETLLALLRKSIEAICTQGCRLTTAGFQIALHFYPTKTYILKKDGGLSSDFISYCGVTGGMTGSSSEAENDLWKVPVERFEAESLDVIVTAEQSEAIASDVFIDSLVKHYGLGLTVTLFGSRTMPPRTFFVTLRDKAIASVSRYVSIHSFEDVWDFAALKSSLVDLGLDCRGILLDRNQAGLYRAITMIAVDHPRFFRLFENVKIVRVFSNNEFLNDQEGHFLNQEMIMNFVHEEVIEDMLPELQCISADWFTNYPDFKFGATKINHLFIEGAEDGWSTPHYLTKKYEDPYVPGSTLTVFEYAPESEAKKIRTTYFIKKTRAFGIDPRSDMHISPERIGQMCMRMRSNATMPIRVYVSEEVHKGN